MAQLVELVKYVLIAGCIVGLLLYVIRISPMAEPLKTWAWFAVIAIAVFLIIAYVLLPMIGSPPSLRLGR